MNSKHPVAITGFIAGILLAALDIANLSNLYPGMVTAQSENNDISQDFDQITEQIYGSGDSINTDSVDGPDNFINELAIVISVDNMVDQRVPQEIKCGLGDSDCVNSAENEGSLEGSNSNILKQEIKQNDKCIVDTDCSNIADNTGSLSETDNSQMIQKIKEKNYCLLYSNCENQGHNDAASAQEDGTSIKQDLDQKNKCIRLSNCNNIGGPVPDESGSSVQKNICVNWSDCSNSGNNNYNLCVHGSSCDNYGDKTKIISVAADCDNGPDGSLRVCQGPRAVTFDNKYMN